MAKKSDDVVVKRLEARTEGQAELIRAIEGNVVTLCDGPAGSGKTFVAVGMALRLLRDGILNKIVFTRPIIESGEHLGALPGDTDDKIKPYFRPIFDSLKAFLSYSDISEMRNRNTIEIVPLAYMRGVTFNNSFMILDEAQNASADQILMYLTRIGQDSRVVLTGDLEQSDIGKNGFDVALKCLSDVPGIGIVKLGYSDVVRNDIISVIIKRFGEFRNGSKNGTVSHRLNGNGVQGSHS